jgi:hypothetical protein
MVTGYDNVSQSHDTVMKSGQHYYENMIMYIYILYSHNKIAQARMLISVSNFEFEVWKYLQKDGFRKICVKIDSFHRGFCLNIL